MNKGGTAFLYAPFKDRDLYQGRFSMPRPGFSREDPGGHFRETEAASSKKGGNHEHYVERRLGKEL